MSKARESMRKGLDQTKGRDTDLRTPSGIFNTYYTLPEGLPSWYAKSGPKGKEKEYYIDIIPFPYGPNFPNEVWKTPWKPGTYPYTMIVDIHKDVGPENIWVLCPKNNYAERCPICEELQALQKDEPDKDKRTAFWKPRRIWRRQFYYVIVRDGGEEEDKGLQVWELPTSYMQDPLDAIRFQGRSGEAIDYWDVDYGKTVTFKVGEKGDYPDYIGHAFDDRIDPQTKKKYVIEDEYIEKACAFPLDQALHRMTYEEVAELWFAEAEVKGKAKEEAKEEDPVPSRRTRNRAAEETVKDEGQTDQEIEAPPVVESRRSRRGVIQPEDPPKDQCPFGHAFGTDCLANRDCEKCENDTYLACEAKKAELTQEKETTTGRRRGK